MAVRCLPSPPLIIHKPSPTNNYKNKNKPFNKVMMVSHTHISSPHTTTPLLQITSSSFKNKVFEDQAKGIVCYRDNNGEIICEGYDEGPRPQQQELTIINCSNQRDAEIVDLLQRSFRQILEGVVELNSADEDVHSNGFNTFC